MAKLHVSTTINGEPQEFLCDADQSMLDVLRGPLGLTGAKEGCGTGDCGACTVTLNGRIVCSCLMLAAEAEGQKIGDRDTIIAAHALSLGAVLVSRNEREFARVPGLKVENWET